MLSKVPIGTLIYFWPVNTVLSSSDRQSSGFLRRLVRFQSSFWNSSLYEIEIEILFNTNKNSVCLIQYESLITFVCWLYYNKPATRYCPPAAVLKMHKVFLFCHYVTFFLSNLIQSGICQITFALILIYLPLM